MWQNPAVGEGSIQAEEVKCFNQTKFNKNLTSSKTFIFLVQTFRNLKPPMVCLHSPSQLISTFWAFLYLTFIFPELLSGTHAYHQPCSLVQLRSDQVCVLFCLIYIYIKCWLCRVAWGKHLLLFQVETYLLLWFQMLEASYRITRVFFSLRQKADKNINFYLNHLCLDKTAFLNKKRDFA